MISIIHCTCPCGARHPQCRCLCECPNTGKKTLYVEMSSSDYNYIVKRLESDLSLMKKFMASIKKFRIKHQIDVLCLEIQPEELDDAFLDSLNNLSL